jgi:hypothetical protein
MDDLLKYVDQSINDFVSGLPSIQQKVYDKLLLLLKDLDVDSGGLIKNSLKNILAIGKIKKEIENIILNKSYTASVGELLSTYSVVADIQDSYFSKLTTDFSPKKVFDQVRKQAVSETADALTESGINANIVDPLRNIIRTNVTSGGSYAELTKQLRNTVLGDSESEGLIESYAKTYVTDAVNTYSRQYGQIITDDLGLDWFDFSGSILKTSRPICLKMHEKRYFHRSQFKDLIKGIVWGEKTPIGKNGFPLGMKEGTTEQNYQTLCNGWQCGHQLIPIHESAVPDEVKKRIEVEA